MKIREVPEPVGGRSPGLKYQPNFMAGKASGSFAMTTSAGRAITAACGLVRREEGRVSARYDAISAEMRL
jgi:hypothetical protein